MRSTERFEMLPFVVEERQLSNVQAPNGWGRGQGEFSAFSTASSCDMMLFVLQLVPHVQLQTLSVQEQLQLRVVP
jgi:hypothetical protein